MANSQSTHSKLSFSARARWRACPLSVHLSHGIADSPSSPAAAVGTAAHGVGEFYVRQQWGLPGAAPGDCPDVERVADLRVGDASPAAWAAWQEQLRTHGKAYRDFIRSLIPGDEVNAYVSVETPVNIRSIHEQLFGTLDLRIWLPNRRVLIVVDYKYGFQDVDVGTPDDPNAQLAAYAIASIEALAPAVRDTISEVWLAVYQPRVPLGDPAKLLKLPPAWIEVERNRLREEVKAVESPGAPRPGDHCRYCPAKGVCPAVQNALQTALTAYAGGRNVLAMDDAEIIALWSARKAVESLMDDIDERVRKLAGAGDKRFKVTLREGRRMWKDAKTVAMTLLALGRHDLLQPVALTEAIAALPAGSVAELVGKSQGSTYISLLEAPAPNVVRDIFSAYVKKS